VGRTLTLGVSEVLLQLCIPLVSTHADWRVNDRANTSCKLPWVNVRRMLRNYETGLAGSGVLIPTREVAYLLAKGVVNLANSTDYIRHHRVTVKRG
jgi:hypothetical protein